MPRDHAAVARNPNLIQQMPVPLKKIETAKYTKQKQKGKGEEGLKPKMLDMDFRSDAEDGKSMFEVDSQIGRAHAHLGFDEEDELERKLKVDEPLSFNWQLRQILEDEDGDAHEYLFNAGEILRWICMDMDDLEYEEKDRM